MAFIEAEAGRQVYYQHHAGAGRPVVLIHGWAMSSRAWTGTIDVLRAAGHAVVAIDQRGCGRSDRDFTDTSIDALASDVVAVVRRLGLDGVVLNGWSLGGAVAVAAVERLNGSVAGLVLTCAASPRYTQASDFPYGGTAEAVRGIPVAMAADRAGFFLGIAQNVCAMPVGQAVVDWMWALFMESGPGVGRSILDLADLDQRELLARLDVPLLSLVGSADTIAPPEIGAQAAEIAKHGRLISFEGAGHAPFVETPDAYHDALLEFLTGLA